MLDETGYLAFDNRNADLLFRVVSRRYEKKSLVMSTNLAFKQWHTIFPTATCAHALIERVVLHADVVKIEGESYRDDVCSGRRGEGERVYTETSVSVSTTKLDHLTGR